LSNEELINRELNQNDSQEQIEHFETQELVNNFKQEYEDTIKLLEEKIIESKTVKQNHAIAMELFNSKLEELQKIIDNMKHVIIEKDIIIKKLQKKLDFQAKSEKDDNFKKDVYIFWDLKFTKEIIAELTRTIKLLKLQNEENERMTYNFSENERQMSMCMREKDEMIKSEKDDNLKKDEIITELTRTIKLLELQNEENERMSNNFSEKEKQMSICMREKDVMIFFIKVFNGWT